MAPAAREPMSRDLQKKLLIVEDQVEADEEDDYIHDLPTPMWVLNVLYFVHEGARMLLLRFMTAYFTHAGLSTKVVGLLQVLGTLMSFFGEYTWAIVADHYFDFRTTVLLCNAFGIVFFLMIPFAPNLPVLCVLYALASYGLSWVGIRDAFSVSTLEGLSSRDDPEAGARQFGRVRKFAALGWGASGLMTGSLEDHFGMNAVFGFFTAMQAVLMTVVCCGVKPPAPPPAVIGLKHEKSVMDLATKAKGGLKAVLLTRHTMLFFANLIVYGTFTALQEVYEFVYLLKGFKGASNTLLGTTLVVMTLSELPVFHYADKLITSGFVPVYTACHILMSVRCALYAMLPYNAPWMVLLIEPFHGATFAAMWAASVEYGRREAPTGCRSRMQALVSGTYFQVSQATGSLMWGFIISDIGFRPSYQTCAAALAIWSVAWNVAVALSGPSPLHGTVDNNCLDPCGAGPEATFKRLRTGSFYRRMTPHADLGKTGRARSKTLGRAGKPASMPTIHDDHADE